MIFRAMKYLFIFHGLPERKVKHWSLSYRSASNLISISNSTAFLNSNTALVIIKNQIEIYYYHAKNLNRKILKVRSMFCIDSFCNNFLFLYFCTFICYSYYVTFNAWLVRHKEWDNIIEYKTSGAWFYFISTVSKSQ